MITPFTLENLSDEVHEASKAKDDKEENVGEFGALYTKRKVFLL